MCARSHVLRNAARARRRIILCCHTPHRNAPSVHARLPRCRAAHASASQAPAASQSPWYSGYNNWHPPLWLKNEQSLGTKYSHAFFWGAGMVTSMVPRDIEPVTGLEAFVTTFTMFGGLLLNAFVISSLTTALASMNAKKEFAGKQLEAIKAFLLIKAVPSEIRHRILEYYEYHFTSSAALAELNMFSRCARASPIVLQKCTIPAAGLLRFAVRGVSPVAACRLHSTRSSTSQSTRD